MKKFFSFLIASLIIVSLVSCKKSANEPDDPSNPSGQVDPPSPSGSAAIAISISNITGASANMSVVPENQSQTYYFTIIESASVASLSDAQLIQQVLIAEMDMIIEYYAGTYDLSYADLLSTGNDGYEFTQLTANTEYLALAAYIDANGKAIDGKLAKQSFKTTNSSTPGGGGSGSTITFNIQKTSTGIKVTPSNNSDYWDYYFLEKSEFTSSWGSDADLVAEAAFEYYGTEYAAPGAEEFLYSEMLEYGMTAGNWVLIVWGCNNSGVTTKAQTVEFTLTGSSSYYAPARFRIPSRKKHNKTIKIFKQ